MSARRFFRTAIMKSTVGRPRRLTDEQVTAILEWYASVLAVKAARAKLKTLRQLARELGVSPSAITGAIQRRGQFNAGLPEDRAVGAADPSRASGPGATAPPPLVALLHFAGANTIPLSALGSVDSAEPSFPAAKPLASGDRGQQLHVVRVAQRAAASRRHRSLHAIEQRMQRAAFPRLAEPRVRKRGCARRAAHVLAVAKRALLFWCRSSCLPRFEPR